MYIYIIIYVDVLDVFCSNPRCSQVFPQCALSQLVRPFSANVVGFALPSGVLDHPDGGGGCQWMVPSDVNVGYLTVCHGKWPIEIDGLPIKHRDFPWLC